LTPGLSQGNPGARGEVSRHDLQKSGAVVDSNKQQLQNFKWQWQNRVARFSQKYLTFNRFENSNSS
jgi:hypothetical protein